MSQTALINTFGQTQRDQSLNHLWLAQPSNQGSGPTGPTGPQGLPGSMFVGVVPNGMTVVNTVADLRTVAPTANTTLLVSGYYVAGDRGGGYFVGDTGKAVGFYVEDGGSVILPTGGNGSAAWLRVPTPDISILFFGAKPNDNTAAAINNVAFQKALNFAGQTGAGLYIPAGVYTLSAALTTTQNLHLYGDGAASVLDFSTYGGAAGTTLLSVSGGYQALPAPVTNGTANLAGQRVLVFTANVALSDNDVIMLHNTNASSFSNFHAAYNNGEFCQITTGSAGATTFELTKGLYTTYNTAGINAFKITSPRVSIHDLRLIGTPTNAVQVLKLSLLVDPVVQNVSMQVKASAALQLDRCFRAALLQLYLNNKGLANAAPDAALSLLSSQHTKVRGGYFYSQYHAVSQGGVNTLPVGQPGNIPTRDTQVAEALLEAGATATDYKATATTFWGNAALSTYSDCTITGGAGLGGLDNGYTRCRITGGVGSTLSYAREITGGKFGFQGCSFLALGSPGSRGFIDFGFATPSSSPAESSPALTGQTSSDVYLTLVNNRFDLPGSTVNDRLVAFTTQNTPSTTSGFVRNISIRIDGLEAINVPNLAAILQSQVAGNAVASSKYIIVDNVGRFPACFLHSSGGYGSVPQRLQSQAGSYLQAIGSANPYQVLPTFNFRYKYPQTTTPVVFMGSTNTTANGLLQIVPVTLTNDSVGPWAQVTGTSVLSTTIRIMWTAVFDTLQ